MDIQEVFKKYDAECLKHSRLGYMKTLFNYFEKRTVDYQNINAYITDGLNGRLKTKYKAATIYTQFNLIRAAYMYCEHLGAVSTQENPFAGHPLPPQIKMQFRRKRKSEYKPVAVEHSVFEIFIFSFLEKRSKDTDLQRICALAYYTGMRLSECCELKWTDIKTNYILLKQTKERFDKKVPLNKFALHLIQSIRKKGKYVFCSPDDKNAHVLSVVISELTRRQWTKYQKENPAVNFAFSFKSLRTAFIQNMQFDGQSIEGIKKAVGHRSTYITDHAYNGSLCTRAIEEFLESPKNEIISKVSGILRREIDDEIVRGIDVEIFVEKVKQAVRESRKVTIHPSATAAQEATAGE
jgi:integrase